MLFCVLWVLFFLVCVYVYASAVGAFWVSFVLCFESAVEAAEPVLVGHVCFPCVNCLGGRVCCLLYTSDAADE